MISASHNPLTVTRMVLVSLLAIVTSVYYPLMVVGIFDSRFSLILLFSSLVLNGWDLISNFRIYREQNGGIGTLSHELGNDKKTRWLTIDILAVIPYELIGLQWFMLLRILKLLRLSQYQKFWRHHDLKRNDALYIVFFLFWMTLAAHWLACGWMILEPVHPGLDRLTTYIEAMYWTIQTLTTVGFGDYTAETQGQMIYSMVVMMFGVGIYGWLIGNVASILSKRDPVEQFYHENMERLKTIVSNRGLPPHLQRKIKEYYDYIYSRSYSGSDEQALLATLPASLQHEVQISLKQEIIRMIPALADSPENFVRDIAGELRTEIFIPGDVIFEEGANGDKMFFLLSGELEVIRRGVSHRLAVLKSGDFFGEMALFEQTSRNATIISITYSETYSLDAYAFNSVLLKYPEISALIEEKVKERKNGSNQ